MRYLVKRARNIGGRKDPAKGTAEKELKREFGGGTKKGQTGGRGTIPGRVAAGKGR